ncbi:MAG TPA: hypothetical protein VGW74_11195 [Propionibacteriaceae bacterium]|nr:hypothetical protein [Propionibacteriaceae bacterium]
MPALPVPAEDSARFLLWLLASVSAPGSILMSVLASRAAVILSAQL